MAYRLTRLDGTPCDRLVLRELQALATEFLRHGVALERVERVVMTRMQRQVRAAIRAHTRLETFKRQLAAWRKGGPTPAYFGADPKRPRAPYAYALTELVTNLRGTPDGAIKGAWPRSRRQDDLQTAVLATVQEAILRQLYPEFDRRDVEWGIRTLTNQLAAQFLAVHYPFLSNHSTPDRLRRRPSLRKPNLKQNGELL